MRAFVQTFIGMIALYFVIALALGLPTFWLLVAIFGPSGWVGILAGIPAVFIASFVASYWATRREDRRLR